MPLLSWAVILLGLTASVGLYLLVLRLRERPLPDIVAAVHGVPALGGVAVLGRALLAASQPAAASVAWVLLVLALLGGAGLVAGFHLRRRPLPLLAVLVHAGVAGAGCGFLLLAWLVR